MNKIHWHKDGNNFHLQLVPASIYDFYQNSYGQMNCNSMRQLRTMCNMCLVCMSQLCGYLSLILCCVLCL